MKTFNLIKTKNGERKGTVISSFYGYSINDKTMLNDVKSYLKDWIDSYTAISDNEWNEISADFDGTLTYDVWKFHLKEEFEE